MMNELILPTTLEETDNDICNSEPICTDERVQLYPIKYEDIWDMYNKAKAAFWVAEEVSLTDDVTDWEKLDEEEKHFILMVLAFLLVVILLLMKILMNLILNVLKFLN